MGRCRTFDENAAGTVFSNGAAVVLLKRVEDAIKDGDTIYAVIKGYATNNDGGDKVSYTAPSVEGQSEVISMALAMADIDPATMGYVEAHGTATPIGDPIEITGLANAYRHYTDEKSYCAIGSLKANLGHLDVASGAIGVIKTALSVHHNELAPQIHFTAPNPRLNIEDSPFYVNVERQAWPERGHPRRASVSSFGVGGTNAHVVMEQAPKHSPRQSPEQLREQSVDKDEIRPELLVLSARTKAALVQQAANLKTHIETQPRSRLVGHRTHPSTRAQRVCTARERGGGQP